jgi:hypothetical protein
VWVGNSISTFTVFAIFHFKLLSLLAFRIKKMFISISFGPINLTKSYYRVCIFTGNVRVHGLFPKRGILKATYLTIFNLFLGPLNVLKGWIIVKKDIGRNICRKNKNICDNFTT